MIMHRLCDPVLCDAATFIATHPEQAQRYRVTADFGQQVLYVPPGCRATWQGAGLEEAHCSVIVADAASLVMHERVFGTRDIVRHCSIAERGSLVYTCMHNVSLLLTMHIVLSAHAYASVACVGSLSGDGRSELTFVQKHEGADSESDVVVRQALHDRASVCVRGSVIIPQHAARTRARQESKGLLVGASTRFSGQPSLKVANTTAFCTHGCAAGPLDRNQLAYVQARGFSPQQAQRLLVEGFLQEPFEHKGVV